MKKVSAS